MLRGERVKSNQILGRTGREYIDETWSSSVSKVWLGPGTGCFRRRVFRPDEPDDDIIREMNAGLQCTRQSKTENPLHVA